MFLRSPLFICCFWFMVVFQKKCPYLYSLNQSCFCRHLPLAVMSESELFLRTFFPAPGYDVWIRVGFVPIYSVKVVVWTPVPICSVWIRDIFRTTVPIYIVWFREVFQETCPYFLCLSQDCFQETSVLICSVWIRVVFEITFLYL